MAPGSRRWVACSCRAHRIGCGILNRFGELATNPFRMSFGRVTWNSRRPWWHLRQWHSRYVTKTVNSGAWVSHPGLASPDFYGAVSAWVAHSRLGLRTTRRSTACFSFPLASARCCSVSSCGIQFASMSRITFSCCGRAISAPPARSAAQARRRAKR